MEDGIYSGRSVIQYGAGFSRRNIATADFLTDPDKAEKQLREALDDCWYFGTDCLMIVPGQGFDVKNKRFRELSRAKMLEMAAAFFTRAVAEAATLIPARRIGADARVGSIEPGKRADFVVCDEKLAIRQVYMGGRSASNGA